MAEFEATSHQGKVIISRSSGRGYRIEMAPSEVSIAKNVIGLVLSMSELNNVPDKVGNPPFVVRIFENHIYALERTDAPGSIPFRMGEGDELLRFLEMGLGICLNEQTHGRVVPVTDAMTQTLVSDESV